MDVVGYVCIPAWISLSVFNCQGEWWFLHLFLAFLSSSVSYVLWIACMLYICQISSTWNPEAYQQSLCFVQNKTTSFNSAASDPTSKRRPKCGQQLMQVNPACTSNCISTAKPVMVFQLFNKSLLVFSITKARWTKHTFGVEILLTSLLRKEAPSWLLWWTN